MGKTKAKTATKAKRVPKKKAARRVGPEHPLKGRLCYCGGAPAQKDLAAVFESQEASIKYLMERNVLTVPHCQSCDKEMKAMGGRIYRCTKCGKKSSVCGNSYFKQCKTGINTALMFLYCWVLEMTHKNISRMTGLSKDTVTHHMAHARQLVATVVEASGDEMKIGGPGRIVQIDESPQADRLA